MGFGQVDNSLIDIWTFGASLSNGVVGANNAVFTLCGDTIAPTYVSDRFNTANCAVSVSKCGLLDLPMKETYLDGDFTFSFWFKPFYQSYTIVKAQWDMLAFVGDGNTTTGGKLHASNSTPFFVAADYDKWYHVVFVLKGAFHGTLYVQNELIDSNFVSGDLPGPYMGKSLQVQGVQALDDFRVYNRALTPGEITQLFNMTSSCSLVTDIGQENVEEIQDRKIIKAIDFLGRPISHIDSYSGPMIVYYSDGSRRKVFQKSLHE
jgi:hypothetical protein